MNQVLLVLVLFAAANGHAEGPLKHADEGLAYPLVSTQPQVLGAPYATGGTRTRQVVSDTIASEIEEFCPLILSGKISEEPLQVGRLKAIVLRSAGISTELFSRPLSIDIGGFSEVSLSLGDGDDFADVTERDLSAGRTRDSAFKRWITIKLDCKSTPARLTATMWPGEEEMGRSIQRLQPHLELAPVSGGASALTRAEHALFGLLNGEKLKKWSSAEAVSAMKKDELGTLLEVLAGVIRLDTKARQELRTVVVTNIRSDKQEETFSYQLTLQGEGPAKEYGAVRLYIFKNDNQVHSLSYERM